ncbi:MAG: molecular chaperone DjlA [Candidatus Neomarinimicrobiota bacterium]|nr:MAG: molecular chaperone DjlA [Candidatus Neomarinimicrobiota bacterium]
MSFGKQLLWGGIGWALGGPIGAIIGVTLAAMSESSAAGPSPFTAPSESRRYPQTRPGDFVVSLLVLFAAVMKADERLLKSELNYVKNFLRQQFPAEAVQDFMVLFRDILNQEYNLRDVCRQIQRSMDHPSRLQLIHVLFGLAQADGQIHPAEKDMIATIARYLKIHAADYQSIAAMFIRDTDGAYTILEIDPSATNEEIKKAYRKMANKYHPDKVAHLGEELRVLAEEKFKAVNEAYQTLKQERGF